MSAPVSDTLSTFGIPMDELGQQQAEALPPFEGHHIFESWAGHPHCIFCGMWRDDDNLPEKCSGPDNV